MYTTIIPSTTIQIPSVVSDSTMLQVSIGTDANDARIRFSQPLIYMMARQIIEKEMAQARRKHPEVDFGRIQEMINSPDKEMKELGIATLAKYTTYTARILAACYDTYNLEFIVEDYTYHNLTNITEDVL